MNKQFTLISAEKLCKLILGILGVNEAEFDGIINDSNLKRLCYIIKGEIDCFDFDKIVELRNLEIGGEFCKQEDVICGYVNIKLNSQEKFWGQTLFEVPKANIIALTKMLIKRFVTNDEIVDIRPKNNDSVIIDLKADSDHCVNLFAVDLGTFAMIGFNVNMYVLDNGLLRIKLTF